MNQKIQQLILIFKEKRAIISGISLGMFLFILFLQPFPNKFPNDYNAIIFTIGFGVIVFLFLFIVYILFPWLFQNPEKINHAYVFSYYNMFSILVLCTLGFAFYLKYVGQVGISFQIMLKIILVNLASPIALNIYNLRKESLNEIRWLSKENLNLKRQIDQLEEGNLKKTIEFISENNMENIKVMLVHVAFIKSADNYVEVFYMENEKPKKKLLRNTLKNIEQQISPYSNFIRCHRTCIINTDYIEKLDRRIGNYWLTIRNFEEQIPVSRPYLLRLREQISRS